jgi:hypothetical protein
VVLNSISQVLEEQSDISIIDHNTAHRDQVSSIFSIGYAFVIPFRYLVRVKKHLQRDQINVHVHEYLRNTIYEYCNSCKKRTQFTCVKCGFCWSCHWLKEEMEKKIPPYITPIEVWKNDGNFTF